MTNKENRITVDQDMEMDEGKYKAGPMNQSGAKMAKDGFSTLDRAEPDGTERRGLSRPKGFDRYWGGSFDF